MPLASPMPLRQTNENVVELETSILKMNEKAVRLAFGECAFVKRHASGNLARTDMLLMNKRAIPNRKTESQLSKADKEESDKHKVSTPAPDILYGYTATTFSATRLRLLNKALGVMKTANSNGLRLPFLLVEFKGDGGSMWQCVNQCMGGAASCVNIGEQLPRALFLHDEAASMSSNSAMFSIAMNGFEARLYICWKYSFRSILAQSDYGNGYRFQMLRAFHLLRLDNYQEFQHCVRNIIDWGVGERLKNIESILDYLASNKRKASEMS